MAERRDYLELALKHCERLGRLATELFELTVLETRDTPLQLEPFSLSELTHDVAQKFGLEIEKKHISGLSGEAFDKEVKGYVEDLDGFLSKHNIKLDAVVGRGGFLNRETTHISCGTYQVADIIDGKAKVDEGIVAAVRDYPEMDHASNLGIPIAAQIAEKYNIPAFLSTG